MKWASVAIGMLLSLQQQRVIEVDVQLQHVTAVARDSSGRFIHGLKAAEFIVEENGVRQEIALFEEESVASISLGIFVDNCWEESNTNGRGSSSLRSINRPPATETYALMEIIGPQDEVSLMGCNDGFENSLRVFEDFTAERSRIERHVGPTSGSILDGAAGCCRRQTTRFDVIDGALEKMQKARNTKRALVLIMARPNPGVAEEQSFKKLLAKIVQYEISVYVFRRDSGFAPTSPSAVQLAAESGGGLFQYTQTGAAQQVARALEADIRSQYLIGYYLKPPAPPTPGTIRVRTELPGHRVTVRRSVNPKPAR